MTFGNVEIWICTHNPNISLIEMAILSASKERENYGNVQISLIDNNSSPKISDSLQDLCKRFEIVYYFLPEPGIAQARYFACKKFKSDFLLFLDDDNILNENYIVNAVDFFRKHNNIGALGGKAFLPYKKDISAWRAKLLPYVGIRDSLGENPLSGNGPDWQPYEPIGAGSILDKSVIDHFCNLDLGAMGYFSLGRIGKGQLSGEDSFIMRQSYSVGRMCAYCPSISIDHHINPDRLKIQRLAKLLYGYGVSDVFLNKSLSKKPTFPYPENIFTLVSQFIYLTGRNGISGIFLWMRHLGQYITNKKLNH